MIFFGSALSVVDLLASNLYHVLGNQFTLKNFAEDNWL